MCVCLFKEMSKHLKVILVYYKLYFKFSYFKIHYLKDYFCQSIIKNYKIF